MLPSQGAAGAQAVHGAREDDLTTVVAGPQAEIDYVISDRDLLRLVLDHQHGVAFVTQLPQQVVHPLDVVRVEPDRRLVEHIGDIGERGSEVPNHLDALSLTTGKSP